MTALSASDLLARQRPGYTLPQALHLDPDIYRLELERIWRPAWLFAAHSAELRRPGDRTVFDIADDSVLLVRGEHGEIGAFHNVCRHRGSRLVDARIASFAGSGSGVRRRLRLHHRAQRRPPCSLPVRYSSTRPVHPVPLSSMGLSLRRFAGRLWRDGPRRRLRHLGARALSS